MRINFLELTGFKSFYNKTSINYYDGLNAIVGPNGCGKSNIFDAICWILGEQNPRRIRAEGMDEVIANGGETLKPLGMAEVTLGIGDFKRDSIDELVIKRRIFRSGETEQYINGIPCRLKDITEILMDSGMGSRAYSIIGQGKIDQMISAEPEEKRKLIEEVAGIVKYKLRRRETESRIEATNANLGRVKDILKEVSSQMGNIRKQAENAQKFRKISEEARQLEIKINQTKFKNLRDRLRDLESERSKITIHISILNDEIKTEERNFNDVKSGLDAVENKLKGLEKSIYNTRSEIQSMHSMYELSVTEIRSTEEFVDKIERELIFLREEKSKIGSQIIVKKRNLESVRSEKSAKESSLLKNEQLLGNLGSEYNFYKVELEKTTIELHKVQDSFRSLVDYNENYKKEKLYLMGRKEGLLMDLSGVVIEKKHLDNKISTFKNELDELNKRAEQLAERKNASFNSLKGLTELLEKKKDENKHISDCLKEAKSRLIVLKQIHSNYEWLPEGIRNFLIERKGDGILGLISDYISVPKGYEKAIEAAFSDKLRWIFVRNTEDALSAVESLREMSIGRSTFIPITSHRAVKSGNEHNIDGREMLPLSQIIEAKEINRDLFEYMLRGVYLVSSLEDAITYFEDIGEDISFVTLEGDVLNSIGAISGGYSNDGVFERKRQIEELMEEDEKLNTELSQNTIKLGQLQSRYDLISQELEFYEKEIRGIEIKVTEISKDITNIRGNINKIQSMGNSIDAELNDVRNQIKEKEDKLAEFSTTLKNLEKHGVAVQNKKNEIEEIVKKFEQKEKHSQNEVLSLRISNATLREQEKQLEEDVADLDKRKFEITEKIELENKILVEKGEEKRKLVQKSKLALEEKDRLSDRLKEMEEELKLKSNVKIDLMESIKVLEEGIERIKEGISEKKHELNKLKIEQNTIEVETNHILGLIQKTSSDVDLDYEDDPSVFMNPDNRDIVDLQTHEQKLEKLKHRIDSFGPVNLLAPQEYINLEERYNFLNEQIEDLVAAISSLKKAINKIDTETVKRFKETYDLVDEKFQEVQKRLFNGGEAKLVLTNPYDLLNTGVEVMVRPKGKRFQSVNLLSGGEKALAAIALIISACFVRPTPFLLFDEIDAPLDDVNTSQFVELVKEISVESQVLIITHNKRTMQAVNYLIGITSGVPGTSKVVSVELQ